MAAKDATHSDFNSSAHRSCLCAAPCIRQASVALQSPRFHGSQGLAFDKRLEQIDCSDHKHPHPGWARIFTPGRTVRLMLWYRSLELAFGHQSSSAADWTLIWLPQSERGGNRHRDVSRLSVGAAGLQRLRPSTIG
ncbi:hypothetical protein MES4922_180128 [Mesorhizobium ventifaucium]|uniref:Uncharacterized protein n=1 Tax=Mesorhizobium ventifaucium TaxID=666020 RepID=A0ABM9DLP7_9HYPH|nr:hypothetical protein MES4922_180128 [Mesorhizobium ventifaucium]